MATALSVVLLLGACDNTVDPFEETGTHAFAISGYLDMGSDTQYVRLAPIGRQTSVASHEDALRMSSTNLSTGETVAWRDALVDTEGGSADHLYYAPFRPDAGASYAVEVQSGGVPPLRAFTHVPAVPSVTVESARTLGSEVSQRVVWNGVSVPSSVQMTYRVRVGSSGTTGRVEIVYEPIDYSTTGDLVQVVIPYRRDAARVSEVLAGRHGMNPIALDSLALTVRALSPEWSQTRQAANIENGEGFFASVARFTVRWTLPDSLAQRIGFDPAP